MHDRGVKRKMEKGLFENCKMEKGLYTLMAVIWKMGNPVKWKSYEQEVVKWKKAKNGL